jgi:hypothetical protein
MNNHDIQTHIVKELRFAAPSFQLLGSGRSLHLGFGEIRYRTLNGRRIQRAEWEVGSYSRCWRIHLNDRVVCDSESTSSDQEVRNVLASLPWESVQRVAIPNSNLVQFILKNNMTVEFHGDSDQKDELCHIFYPPSMVAVYEPSKGWKFGESDKPWKG